MKFEDLSAEDQALLNTDLGDFEKEAAAEMALAQEMYQTGFSKLAAETADYIDSLLVKEAEEKEEDKEEEEDEENKKTASDLGAFIERGFFDGLCKLGQERHGDASFYLVPYLEEKVAAKAGGAAVAGLQKMLGKAKEYGSAAAGKAKEYGSKGVAAVKDYGKGAVSDIKGGYAQMGKGFKMKPGAKATAKQKEFVSGKKKQHLLEGGKSMAKGTAKLVGPAAGLGLAGWGASKALSKKDGE